MMAELVIAFFLSCLPDGAVIPDPMGLRPDGLRIVRPDEFTDRAIIPPAGYVLCAPAKYPDAELLWIGPRDFLRDK